MNLPGLIPAHGTQVSGITPKTKAQEMQVSRLAALSLDFISTQVSRYLASIGRDEVQQHKNPSSWSPLISSLPMEPKCQGSQALP